MNISGTSIGISGTGVSTITVGGNVVVTIGIIGRLIGPVFPVFVSGSSTVTSSTSVFVTGS